MGGPGLKDPVRGQIGWLCQKQGERRGGGAPRGSKLFSERRRRGQPPGCASLSLPGRRRVPARSPGLGRQESKFDQAVGEERDTLLGDAGNLQPVLQDVEFHRPPALHGGSSAGGEPRPPPPARPASTERCGQPVRGPGARRLAGRRTKGRPAKPRGAAGGGRGRQSRRSSGSRRPARRAAGVRCNKQLATQTPARWACAAAAGRAGTCSRARPGRCRLLMSGAGRPRDGPAGCTRNAGAPAPTGPLGRQRAEMGAFRASLSLRASSVTQTSGLGALGCKASRQHYSSAGGGPSLGGERFGEIGKYRAEKQNRDGCWAQRWGPPRGA